MALPLTRYISGTCLLLRLPYFRYTLDRSYCSYCLLINQIVRLRSNFICGPTPAISAPRHTTKPENTQSLRGAGALDRSVRPSHFQMRQ